MYSSDPFDAEKQQDVSPASLPFVISGTIIAVLMIGIPSWNAVVLLSDVILMQFVRWWWSAAMLVTCFFLLLFVLSTLCLFTHCGRQEVKSDPAHVSVASMLVTLYGAILVLMSFPLAEMNSTLKQEVLFSCGAGRHTHTLYEEFLFLSHLRADPDCASQETVETCAGYTETSESLFLRTLENDLRCSGYCYQSLGSGLEVVNIPYAAGLSMALGWGFNGSHSTAVYPPTLFTQENWKASCSGMSLRYVDSFLNGISDETFWEGVMLCFVCSLSGFLMMAGVFRAGWTEKLMDKERERRARYGAVPLGTLSTRAVAG